MNSVKFITSSELHHVRTLFSLDNRVTRMVFSDQDVDNLIRLLHIKMDVHKSCQIVMTFDETNSPISMYAGYEFPKAGGWYIGLTKVLNTTNHYNLHAPIIAPALDLLISTMESKGYYKFWMGAPEKHHNIRNTVMCKHSKMLNRYSWYDEEVVPQGTRPTVPMFAVHFHITPVDWTDIVVRMFVLKQRERVAILKQQGHKDYNGTIIDSVE